MRVASTRQTGPAYGRIRDGRVVRVLRRLGRFAAHLAEMCMVMCAGAIALSLLFFGAARLLGFTDLPQTAPELSAFVVALNLSVPMAVWMRFRGMEWRPTVEMSSCTMVTGLLLVVAYWMDLVAGDSMIEIQTRLACPIMLIAMLFRFRRYSSSHSPRYADAARRERSTS